MSEELEAIRGGDIHDLVEFGDGSEIYHDETRYYYKNAVDEVLAKKDIETTKFKVALWLMTAEWAEAMGLASCNIANKFMSRESFEVSDDYRNNTIKKYRHRQVVFYKYADYCRAKAEEYK